MLKSLMIRSTVIAWACALSFTAHAMADTPKEINVPAGELGPALESLQRQSGVELVFRSDELKGFRTEGLKGTYQPKDAIRLLLKGTPLELRTDSSGAMLIILPHKSTPSSMSDASSESAGPGKSRDTPDGMYLAQLDQGANSRSAAPPGDRASAQEPAKDQAQLEEVLVTAQKRAERLQNVPVPVTAISAQTLVDNELVRLQDYYSSVPGLALGEGSRGEETVSIRGINGGASNPTVGITIDDVPFGSSTSLGGGFVAPDIDPSDLSRIEVLRGPQGTLYGVSSMGGLLKYVTIDPSFDAVSGRLQVGTDTIYNAANLGYSLRGSINLPVTDNFAMRASAFGRKEPGYIDDVETGQRGVNKVGAFGARVAALWHPSNLLSLKLGAIVQNYRRDAASAVPTSGDLQYNNAAQTGWYETKTQAYSAIFNAKPGNLDIVAVTGYNVNTWLTSTDLTPFASFYGASMFGVSGAAVPERSTTYKFSQEIRVSASLGAALDWLVGGFYTREDSPYLQNTLAIDPATGAFGGVLEDSSWLTTYAESAAFADLTFHLTDRFDIQIGGRKSHPELTYTFTASGPDATPGVPKVRSSENAFTYLFTPSFKLTNELMLYARLASGYRPGGPNIPTPLASVPVEYRHDTTQNYDVGMKQDLLNHALSIDLSLYYIDWKDIQQLIVMPNGVQFYTNGGRAKSQGIELSVESRPLDGLKIAGWIVWNDAALTQTPPANTLAGGVAGERLPGVSPLSGSLSLDQEFPIADQLSGFLGVTASYVGYQWIGYPTSPTATRLYIPGYAKTDLRAGSKYRSWTLTLFATNLTNRRGLLGQQEIYPNEFNVIQPRTIGLSLAKTFF